ncbi:CAP domain-containing protein [Pontibacillus litoralis]|uniref:Uncharacterized protein n=1 Tax=Pontibacillus litoralis JSM 072002 TaxID=1385512 RepID=A0A0A5G628_9BACI|nr:CAP domain-containing protein [Pontibacillus litoralis]KGX88571.1 hypothetical protein N784_07830 [Pontibacillus litoralis JSM 072002]
MKRLIRVLVLIITMIIVFPLVEQYIPSLIEQGRNEEAQPNNQKEVSHKEQQLDKQQEGSINDAYSSSIIKLMGQSEERIIEQFGQPVRRDETSYAYSWWIYKWADNYMQIGMQDGKVVTVYRIGEDLALPSIETGANFVDVWETFDAKQSQEVEINNKRGSFQLQLTEQDLKQRPLLHVQENIYMQLYFDTLNDALSSVRLVTDDVLLQHRSYEMYYRGTLPEVTPLSSKDWMEIETNTAQQVFDITNHIRKRWKQSPLKWDEQVASVAFQHSKDMKQNNYFSHIAQDGNGLKERLEKGEVRYLSAGENIAAQYPDAPAVVEGWLNSEGHREALLHESYTHLGVGVYRYYYTQNFIEKRN